jgi:hypothetical protein
MGVYWCFLRFWPKFDSFEREARRRRRNHRGVQRGWRKNNAEAQSTQRSAEVERTREEQEKIEPETIPKWNG